MALEIFRTEQWPIHHTVALLTGSLPMGGMVLNTPVHAFASAPAALMFAPLPPESVPVMRTLSLGKFLAFTIDPVVTATEADTIIEASERFGYRDESPGIRTPPVKIIHKR